MKLGLFSFFLVVAFIPSILYAASIHSQVVGRIVTEKTVLIEQQALTNREYEFEQTFWTVAVNSAKNSKNIENELKLWRKAMKDRQTKVWTGPAGPEAQEPTESFECIVERSPDGKNVEIKKSTNPYYAIGATVHAGNATSMFLIPAGCSRGL